MLETKINLINQNKLNKKNKLHNNIEQHNKNLILQINSFNKSINLFLKQINKDILSQIKNIILSVQKNKNKTGGGPTNDIIPEPQTETDQELLDYEDIIQSFTDLEEFIFDLGIDNADFEKIINLLNSNIDTQSFLLNHNSKIIKDTEELNKTENFNFRTIIEIQQNEIIKLTELLENKHNPITITSTSEYDNIKNILTQLEELMKNKDEDKDNNNDLKTKLIQFINKQTKDINDLRTILQPIKENMTQKSFLEIKKYIDNTDNIRDQFKLSSIITIIDELKKEETKSLTKEYLEEEFHNFKKETLQQIRTTLQQEPTLIQQSQTIETLLEENKKMFNDLKQLIEKNKTNPSDTNINQITVLQDRINQQKI